MQEIDFFSESYASRPYQALENLRNHSPVTFHDQTGLWLISRHEDIRSILLDHATFLPDNALTAITPLSIAALQELAASGFSLPPTLANNGTSTHPSIRRVTSRFIGPRQASLAKTLITDAVSELFDEIEKELANQGQCDLVATFAEPLPCWVVLEMIGIKGDIPTIRRWSAASLELFWGRPDAERQMVLAKEVGAFYQWLAQRVGELKHDESTLPGALTALGTLPNEDIVGACYFTLIAGQETTTQLLSSIFLHTLKDRDLIARLQSKRELIPGWVDEMLRREPPLTTWRRITARNVEISGVSIPKGAQLLLMLAGAGSDPSVFEEPENMCPHRANADQHLAFGLGKHRCPGAELAKLEAEIALEQLLDRLPDLQLLESDPPQLQLLSFRAPIRVLVSSA